MKILLVAQFSNDTILGVIGNYSRNALLKIGAKVEVFDFRASQYLKNPAGSFLKRAFKKICSYPRQNLPFIYSLEQEKMNNALLSKIDEFHPDIMLAMMGETILPQTLKKIKEKGGITANWFLDTVIDPRGNRMPWVQQVSPYYDFFFIYDSEEILREVKIGAQCVKSIPLACDPSVHKSINLTQQETKQYGSNICFIGSLDNRRQELLKCLAGFDLGIWGNWVYQDPLLKSHYRKKHVYLEEAAKIYNASKIALDSHIFFGSDRKAFDINPRVYETTGCGAFTITNDSPYLGELYEIDKEIVCYKNAQELKEKINYYLSHPEQRKAIARRGQERAHRDHTYEKRLKTIISTIESQASNLSLRSLTYARQRRNQIG